MTMEPTRELVLQWLELTGRSQSDAVAHFWPDADDAERRKHGARLRQWVKRDRDAGRSRVAAPLAGAVPAAQPPDPRPENREPAYETLDPDAHPVDFLAAELRNNIRACEEALRQGRYTAYPGLDRRVGEVHARLQLERERERRVVKLERTPAAISAELARRTTAIALRAEMQRRKLAASDESREDE